MPLISQLSLNLEGGTDMFAFKFQASASPHKDGTVKTGALISQQVVQGCAASCSKEIALEGEGLVTPGAQC